MQPESRKLLWDMLEAATAIIEFAVGRDFAEIGTDRLLRSGIYYQFIIVGEALTQLRSLDRQTYDRISEASRIVGFRNQVVHGYSVIRDDVTWQIIQD
jgi:uncharacterized protein with HEPN domain